MVFSKNLLLKLSLSLIAIIFSLFLGEFILRLFFKAWPFEESIKLPYLTARDEVLRWRFSPGNGRNSLGLRNREIAEKKDKFRILFLGDSLVWSGDTSSGELYTQVIEKNLNKDSYKLGYGVEAINAGIPGYTTYQEFEFLKIYGLDMKPDLVILGFVMNDLHEYFHKPTKNKILGLDPERNLNRFDVDTFPGCLVSRSYLAHVTVWAFDLALEKLTGLHYFRFNYRSDTYLAWKDYAWKREGKIIEEINELLKKNGIKFVIVSFPLSEQVDDKNLKINRDYVLSPQKKLKEVCDSYGISFLDLTDAIYQNGGTSLFKDYFHLKPRGNDVVAQELTDYLDSLLYNTKSNPGNIKKNENPKSSIY